MESALKYRADIDGLRAVAVLSVLVFHFGAPLPADWRLSGGFTGVDVFFVISGFLITANLTNDIRNNAFSILGFYDRRIRRILPALLFVLAVTLLAGRFLLLPGEYISLGSSSAAASFGVSNFYFLFNTGYFDQSAELMPLLHTWSLAVEEQFYLVWPPLLYWIARNRSRGETAAIIVGIVLLGFALSLVWFETNSKSAFFMSLPRAWELALGAALVFLSPLPRYVGEAAIIVGLGLIGFGFVFITAKDFPGLSVVLPCVGAALVIWPRVGRSKMAYLLGLLSPIGLISYSLYLIHWPVWVFFRVYINNATPSASEAIALAAVSIALAVLSYFLIERPTRRLKWSRLQMISAGYVGCIFILCASEAVRSSQGMPDRMATIAAMSSYDQMWYWTCPTKKTLDDLPSQCLFGSEWDEPSAKAVFWGDSHAMVYASIIHDAAKANNVSILLSTQCVPFFDGVQVKMFYGQPQYQTVCPRENQRMLEGLERRPEIELVLIASSWDAMAYTIYKDAAPPMPLDQAYDLIEKSLDQVIVKISRPGRRIVLLTSVPNWGLRDPLPCELLEASLLRRPCSARETILLRSDFETQKGTIAILQRIATRRPDVTIIYAGDRLCPEAECTTRLNGEPLYLDTSHLRRNLPAHTNAELSDIFGFTSLLRSLRR